MARKINYETRKCDGNRRNSSEGLEEPGRRRGIFFIMLLDLLQKMFEQEKLPEEWRYSIIVPIFKEMGPSRVGGIIEASR